MAVLNIVYVAGTAMYCRRQRQQSLFHKCYLLLVYVVTKVSTWLTECLVFKIANIFSFKKYPEVGIFYIIPRVFAGNPRPSAVVYSTILISSACCADVFAPLVQLYQGFPLSACWYGPVPIDVALPFPCGLVMCSFFSYRYFAVKLSLDQIGFQFIS